MADVRIGYITSDFAQLNKGQKATLLCNGKKLTANIYLSCYVPTVIKYGSQTTRIDAGKYVTLLCNGKKATDDIIIEALKESKSAGIYYFNDDAEYNVWELYSLWEDMTINVETNYTSSTYQSNSLSGYNNVIAVGEDIVMMVIPIVTKIGNYCFYNASPLYEIEIADGLTSIGTYAFRNCSNLKSIKIPNSVTSIGTYIFGDCTTLETVEIGSSVSTIPQNAFRGCNNLKTIKVNGSPSTIGTYAFGDCTALEVLDFRNATVIPTLSASSAFNNVPSTCEVIIPDNLYDDWIDATNWVSRDLVYVKASEA